MQLGVTGDSKLPAGVNVSVNGGLSPRVSRVIDRRPVPGVPRLPSNDSGDWFQLPATVTSA